MYLGMAGVVPYLVTSLQTSYLAWEMNNAAVYGAGHYISGETAQAYMHLLEPIQVGYGAVVSFHKTHHITYKIKKQKQN